MSDMRRREFITLIVGAASSVAAGVDGPCHG
jgi:hypothetical protein